MSTDFIDSEIQNLKHRYLNQQDTAQFVDGPLIQKRVETPSSSKSDYYQEEQQHSKFDLEKEKAYLNKDIDTPVPEIQEYTDEILMYKNQDRPQYNNQYYRQVFKPQIPEPQNLGSLMFEGEFDHDESVPEMGSHFENQENLQNNDQHQVWDMKTRKFEMAPTLQEAPSQSLQDKLQFIKLRASQEIQEKQKATKFVGKPPLNPLSKAYREQMAQQRQEKENEAKLNPISRKARTFLQQRTNSQSAPQSESSKNFQIPNKFKHLKRGSTIELNRERKTRQSPKSVKQSQNKKLMNTESNKSLKLPEIIKKQQSKQSNTEITKKKTKWQIQSEQFRNAMKGGSKQEIETMSEGQFDDRKQCPHCRRRFNPDPYDRHIPICPRNKNRVTLKL